MQSGKMPCRPDGCSPGTSHVHTEDVSINRDFGGRADHQIISLNPNVMRTLRAGYTSRNSLGGDAQRSPATGGARRPGWTSIGPLPFDAGPVNQGGPVDHPRSALRAQRIGP